jgi:hypothetical protein
MDFSAQGEQVSKEDKRLDRIEQQLRTLTPDKVFNKPNVGLASIFQKLVRLRARFKDGNCRCITCGKVQHYKLMDAGHFVGRNNKATILDSRNVNPQCKKCNSWGSGEKDKYREALVKLYGIEVVRELETRTLPKNHVWDRRELAKLKIEFLDEIKELERD